MTKLFVGGLPYSVTSEELKNMFSNFGAVMSAAVITDRFSGESKGFGFVEMDNDSEAQAAIKALDGSDQNGRKIAVSVAKPREERPQGGGFGRDSGGGYNRGGGGAGGGFNRGGSDHRGGGRR